jgi:hypothetical protein
LSHFKINNSKCKYFISDFQARWLATEGGGKIIPTSPETHFRYLGLWLSLSLDWSKQILVLNKYIMDWRWKAKVAKVDAAQLKSSVIDYLLPRMDIGLLHADVTQKMCHSWQSSIVHTICERAGMSNANSINRKAFCLLAGLPDIWLRTQTTRATDILVNINTRYCQSGRSTMARICALAGKTCYELKDAITYLQDAKAYLKCRARVSQTIKHLHKLEIKLACPCQSDMHPVTLTSEIRQIIEMKEMKEVLAYTDGSTKARSHEANSGCGIYLTDLEGKKVWSGGCVVRTDGNNFIAEIAAASIMIMACPPDVLLEIRIDSMAAIGALSKGILSERKRIRASGRSWLNWCRQEWQAKTASHSARTCCLTSRGKKCREHWQ